LTKRDAALDLGLVLLAMLIYPFGQQLIGFAWAPSGMLSKDVPFPVSLFIAEKCLDALVVLALAGYLVWRHRLAGAAFGFRLGKPAHELGWSAAALGGAYAVMFGSMAVVLVALAVFPALQQDLKNRLDFAQKMPLNDLAAAALLLIPVAIHEEVLFRGLLLPYLRRLTNHWTLAVIFGTLLFAVLHLPQGVLGVAQIACVGAVFAVIFIRTQRLLPVIVAHYAFDFCQLLLMRVVVQWQGALEHAAGG
jgi:membrane protease YdiL (CAAX protease family)